MRDFIGLAVVIFGIVLGIYVGAWVLFVGGIVQLIEGVKASPVNAPDIAIGILKFLAAAPCGWIIAFIGIGLGRAIMD